MGWEDSAGGVSVRCVAQSWRWLLWSQNSSKISQGQWGTFVTSGLGRQEWAACWGLLVSPAYDEQGERISKNKMYSFWGQHPRLSSDLFLNINTHPFVCTQDHTLVCVNNLTIQVRCGGKCPNFRTKKAEAEGSHFGGPPGLYDKILSKAKQKWAEVSFPDVLLLSAAGEEGGPECLIPCCLWLY